MNRLLLNIIVDFMKSKEMWASSCTELLNELRKSYPKSMDRYFKMSNQLSKALFLHKKALAERGIIVGRQHSGSRTITLMHKHLVNTVDMHENDIVTKIYHLVKALDTVDTQTIAKLLHVSIPEANEAVFAFVCKHDAILTNIQISIRR